MSEKSPTKPRTNWEEQKDKLKLKFPKLTDADLNFDESKKFEMLTQLQVKVGRTAKELQEIIESL
jgi:thymidylate synthase